MKRVIHIQNKILEETLILSIVQRNLGISGYGISHRCREKGLIFAERCVNNLLVRMINDDLIVRRKRYELIITKFGESKLLSNRCLLRQLIL